MISKLYIMETSSTNRCPNCGSSRLMRSSHNAYFSNGNGENLEIPYVNHIHFCANCGTVLIKLDEINDQIEGINTPERCDSLSSPAVDKKDTDNGFTFF